MIDFRDVIRIMCPKESSDFGTVERITDNYGRVLWDSPGSEDFRDLYQRVEYIASSGGDDGGWIEANYEATAYTGMCLIAEFDTLVNVPPMGCRGYGGKILTVPYPSSPTTLSAYSGANAFSTSSLNGNANTLSLAVGTVYKLELENTRLNVAYVLYEGVTTSDGLSFMRRGYFNISTPSQLGDVIGIFRYFDYRNDHGDRRPMKVYEATISQDGEVVRKYIPCYRKSDGKVGMYDMYSKVFCASQGTLTVGPGIDW